MPDAVHGYSGKPLHQKLGIKAGMRCLLLNGPSNYRDLIGDVDAISLTRRRKTPPSGRHYPFVHLFVRDTADLENLAKPALAAVDAGGMLWVSWPKKSSSMFRDLTEDGIRDVLLGTTWVDVKVCAVDADWSGLKFLRRRKR